MNQPPPPLLDSPRGALDAEGGETLRQDEDELLQGAQLSRRSEQPPAQIPGYAIAHLIGEGAYGSVWLARERNTGKQVAVKFYTHCRGLDWPLLNREVEKLAVLHTSRNIVRLLEVGWDGDPPYYIMEYLAHGSLDEKLRAGPLPVAEAVALVKSLLSGLIHAHGAGILHCDLKPANVLLDAHGEGRLGDFGQSRLSGERSPALGTLFYMAPEQADLKAVPDARWDVYAAGAILYHMLAGTAPFRTPAHEERLRNARTLPEKLAAYREILRSSPKPAEHRRRSGVDRRLAEIVDRALEIDPRKRFPNAQAMLDRLEQRDRFRSRRPLMALGILGPGLLLAAMTPVFFNAVGSAVASSEQTQARSSLDGDEFLGGLLALGLERDLQNRLADLQALAENPRLAETVARDAGKPWSERAELKGLMESLKRSVVDGDADASWFVADARGNQIWRDPYNAATMDRNFAHRDYFHGREREMPSNRAADEFRHIESPHVSTAFLSDATRRYMVALSVPIFRDLPNGDREFVGVLARTTHLGRMLEEYGRRIAAREEGRDVRFVTLADMRQGMLLDHPWMTSRNLAAVSESTFRGLALSPETLAALAPLADEGEAASLRLERYADPARAVSPDYAGEWLATLTPVGNTGWVAIVQERRDVAMRPVEKMRRDMMRYGIGGLAIACGLIATLWVFVLRALNDRTAAESGELGNRSA